MPNEGDEDAARARGHACDEGHQWRLLEDEAANRNWFADGCPETDESSQGVAHQVGRIGVERAKELEQILDVRPHDVLLAFLEILVGPGVATAVGDGAIASSNNRQLQVPCGEITDRAVHEDDRLPSALLAVGETGAVDLGGL